MPDEGERSSFDAPEAAHPQSDAPGVEAAEIEAPDVVAARTRAVEAEAETGPSPAALAARAELAGLACVPGVPKPDPILVAHGVRRDFGGLRAVDVAHLEVQRGTITALIGPNGAGKTTLFNLLTGFDRPSSGTWSFNGKPISSMPAYKVARQGMVRTFQLTKALSLLTCLENLKLAAVGQRGESFLGSFTRPLWRTQERDIEGRARALLARFNLDRMGDEYAATLSGGQRKLLEMARALMVEPSLIMLDEPMAGVNPALTQSLLGHVIDLRDEGVTVVFVEHDMDVVMGISDWVVCMAAGEVIAEGPPASMGKNDAVIDAYLGRQHDEAAAS